MLRLPLPFALVLIFATQSSAEEPNRQRTDWVNTFSIVAFDPEREEWGVAVASRYLAVGSAVPFAQAKVGAIATQASVNVSFGPAGLKLLEEGKSADEVLKKLLEGDPGRDSRQLAIVDAKGNVAAHTGSKCFAWAGSKQGKHYSVQGIILAGEQVVADMADAFEKSKGILAWRLMAALEAAEKAGGDKRGKQSAAILVVRAGSGPNGFGDRLADFRVDDHENPIPELARILGKRFGKPKR